MKTGYMARRHSGLSRRQSGSVTTHVQLALNSSTTNIPEAMNNTIPTKIHGKMHMLFKGTVQKEWYNCSMEYIHSGEKAQPIVFVETKESSIYVDWVQSEARQELPASYVPIVLASAHDADTRNTLMQRVLHVTKAL